MVLDDMSGQALIAGSTAPPGNSLSITTCHVNEINLFTRAWNLYFLNIRRCGLIGSARSGSLCQFISMLFMIMSLACTSRERLLASAGWHYASYGYIACVEGTYETGLFRRECGHADCRTWPLFWDCLKERMVQNNPVQLKANIENVTTGTPGLRLQWMCVVWRLVPSNEQTDWNLHVRLQ
jgi:hypothetical protein